MHGWDRTGGWLLQAARPCIEDHESPSPPDQPAYPPAGEYVRQAMVEAVQLSFPRASAQGGARARTCGTSVINKPPLIAQPLDRRGHRDSLDLDQKVVADQPPDLHGGAWDVHGGGTGHATGTFSGVVVGDDEVYGRGGSDRALLTGCALCPEPPFEAVADVEGWVLDGPVEHRQVVQFGALEGARRGMWPAV